MPIRTQKAVIRFSTQYRRLKPTSASPAQLENREYAVLATVYFCGVRLFFNGQKMPGRFLFRRRISEAYAG